MEVGRIYEMNSRWHGIMRLWSLETVFSSEPSEQGIDDTIDRLRRHRDDVQEVINELKHERESESWLEF